MNSIAIFNITMETKLLVSEQFQRLTYVYLYISIKRILVKIILLCIHPSNKVQSKIIYLYIRQILYSTKECYVEFYAYISYLSFCQSHKKHIIHLILISHILILHKESTKSTKLTSTEIPT